MTDASHPRRAPPSPWWIVTLDEHVRPTDSQPAAMRRRWRALARLLRSEDPDQAHARAETELRRLSAALDQSPSQVLLLDRDR